MSEPKRTKKSERKPLLIFFPVEIVQALDDIVQREDTDRSKYIRKAVRNALRRPA